MKNLLFFIFLASTSIGFSQDVKIKWEDNQGREFSITAPSGKFSFGMIAGDNISYDFSGDVSKVGSVNISYDFSGDVSKVGGLTVNYDFSGRVTGTSGSVN